MSLLLVMAHGTLFYKTCPLLFLYKLLLFIMSLCRRISSDRILGKVLRAFPFVALKCKKEEIQANCLDFFTFGGDTRI